MVEHIPGKGAKMLSISLDPNRSLDPEQILLDC
nr:MAG TPA: hypothetical protein [Bacteriophage sp.]